MTLEEIMENYIVSKIKIGISACQFGANVRYNGKGWDMTDYLKREKTNLYGILCAQRFKVV